MQPHDLSASLDKLFTAFPLNRHSDDAHTQRKRQYQLYHERLSELPADLVECSVLELIDTATYLPRIGTIRARVQARIKHQVAMARAAEPEADDHERMCAVRSLGQVPPVGDASSNNSQRTNLLTGPCPCIRDVDGTREPCGRPYEYTVAQAYWLRKNRELLLCTRCAGEYLQRQGELRRQEAIWAERLLAGLSPQSRPTQDDVKRLRALGYGKQLRERLIAIGAHSSR